MANAVREVDLDMRNPDDWDRLLLSVKPSQKATRYSRIVAFGNHFRMEDSRTAQLKSYNSGVASVFELPTENVQGVSINYVGVLKDILLLDYRGLNTTIILLRCKWVKPQDSRGNAAYTRDDAGFLVVNFRQKLGRLVDPFIFPSQAKQVFFSDVVEKPGWKVVLRKEARARREVVDKVDAFISTSMESTGMIAPQTLPSPPSVVNLVGAIELTEEDNLLAHDHY